MRLKVNQVIRWSPEALLQYSEAKQEIWFENHTYKPHNMKTFPRDTDHEWLESASVPNLKTNILVANNSEEKRPNYTKRRYFFLSALIGMNWNFRRTFSKKTSYASFNLEKHIIELGPKPILLGSS